jgi:S-adenosylmethionine-dependent methyltransferase
MMEDTKARFDAGAEAWASYNQQPLGRIRREVTWHNLAPHLPDVSAGQDPPRVLDAGGGSGELALRLVRRGYRVWLLDYAPGMVDQAREASGDLPDGLRARLSFCIATAEEAAHSFPPRFFDAITCHTLIEYLPNPRATLASLSSLLGEGGLLSVSFVNRHAELLRQVWSRHDPAGALSGLAGGAFRATLFDVPGETYTAEQVSAWLTDLGLGIAATCGVRAFADYVPRERLEDPEYLDTLLQLEKAVANRPPYMLLARYVHLLARRRVEPA